MKTDLCHRRETIYQGMIRFYGHLMHFCQKGEETLHSNACYRNRTSVKDLIEEYGVPHTEVDLVLVDGRKTDTKHYRSTHG